MLEFQPLTAGNFPAHAADILRSEEIFPEALRETGEDYLVALKQRAALGLVAHHRGRYVGNVVGFNPDRRQRRVLRLDHLPPKGDDFLYLFNIVTMPEYQGQGCGRHLLQEFCNQARQAGFSRINGHFRGNGSLKNFTALGGRPLAHCENWFATGECYTYCELQL